MGNLMMCTIMQALAFCKLIQYSSSTTETSREGTFRPKSSKTASEFLEHERAHKQLALVLSGYYMSTLSKVDTIKKNDYSSDLPPLEEKKDDLGEHKDGSEEKIIVNCASTLSENTSEEELADKVAPEKIDLSGVDSDVVVNPAVETTKIDDESASEDTNCTKL